MKRIPYCVSQTEELILLFMTPRTCKQTSLHERSGFIWKRPASPNGNTLRLFTLKDKVALDDSWESLKKMVGTYDKPIEISIRGDESTKFALRKVYNLIGTYKVYQNKTNDDLLFWQVN